MEMESLTVGLSFIAKQQCGTVAHFRVFIYVNTHFSHFSVTLEYAVHPTINFLYLRLAEAFFFFVAHIKSLTVLLYNATLGYILSTLTSGGFTTWGEK